MFASSLRTKRDLKEQVPGLEVCLLLYVLNAPSFFLAWQVWPLEAVKEPEPQIVSQTFPVIA